MKNEQRTDDPAAARKRLRIVSLRRMRSLGVCVSYWGYFNPHPEASRVYTVGVNLEHMNETLLQRAKPLVIRQGKPPKFVSTEHQELAVAWLNDEVSFARVAVVLGIKGSNVYSFLATALKAAHQSKLL